MPGKVLQLDNFITKDNLACQIANQWFEWDVNKQVAKARWQEVQEYVYATDTTDTANVQLEWNNKTTIPKLCQISDNLHANYMASMFPKRRWLIWEGAVEAAEDMEKKTAIRDYMSWVIDQPWYKEVVEDLVRDFIHYGNCFSTVEWKDDRVELEDRTQAGYVGPVLRRISPLDIVFNPTAPTFAEAPKIVRSLVSMGELKEILLRSSTTPEDQEYATNLYNYLREYRVNVGNSSSELAYDAFFSVDGFSTYRNYLLSGYVEVLTFYGDLFDQETGEFYRNRQIRVVDKHKIVYNKPNPSYFGRAPIYHAGWRNRQDNLWSMGPLENLLGMQYRVDHIENMKADLFDLTAFPPIKRKGYVEDFTWGPMAEIIVDQDGDVELMTPDVNIVQFNQELAGYLQLMEEMAGAPKEAMGFRTPGEKTMYEVQRLENAASRIFQSKIRQFEEQQIEPGLNALLELARRQMDSTVVRVIDDEEKIAVFRTLTPQDITGQGRIRPVAARHFAEKAERLQNITTFSQSPLWAAVQPHVSGEKLTDLITDLLEIEDWGIFQPNVAVAEQAQTQRIMNAAGEDVMTEAATPAGIAQDDI